MVLFHCQCHFHCHISVKKEQNLLRLFFDQLKEVAYIASLRYAFLHPAWQMQNQCLQKIVGVISDTHPPSYSESHIKERSEKSHTAIQWQVWWWWWLWWWWWYCTAGLKIKAGVQSMPGQKFVRKSSLLSPYTRERCLESNDPFATDWNSTWIIISPPKSKE